jgi:hypothetical protein
LLPIVSRRVGDEREQVEKKSPAAMGVNEYRRGYEEVSDEGSVITP